MKTAAKRSESSPSLADQIAKRILKDAKSLKKEFDSAEPFRCCYVDDLLPEKIVSGLTAQLPPLNQMLRRRTLRESKRVSVQVAQQDSTFAELLSAFNDPQVLKAVEAVTGLKPLIADPSLYASGLSVMGKGDFLNPHLDNSHDGDQKNYRAINVLYYLSENWPANEASGGNLELWSEDFQNLKVIGCEFNRLAIMETHDGTWHSVSPVLIDGLRVCISTYYFTEKSPHPYQFRHVTTFRARPGQFIRDAILIADGWLRNYIGKKFPSTLKNTKHRLKK
jgi:Rps23 Pro-64 3,4-dihydroxylase Tpa1-like proline 4-hydroxylase